MTKPILLLCSFCLAFHIHAYGIVKHAVLFGEHSKHVPTLEEGTFRIFLDMNGHFYPEDIISNEELRYSGNSQLKIWSKNHPDKFQQIAKAYNLINTNYSKINYSILQDSIRQSIINTINTLGKSKLSWIIHGYRKKIYKNDIDNSTSISDNVIVQNRIKNYVSVKENNLNIEVYWDGKYLKRGGFFRTVRLGILFKHAAIPNAMNCGYALREIFSNIKCQNIYLISHSAGTFVVSSLLFNKKRKYKDRTPNQSSIRIALMASASPGKKLFKHYYDRNSPLDFKNYDNYSLYNFMNEDDFVLLKQKGAIKVPRMLGNTTLGCNFKNESGKLRQYFEKKFSNSSYQEGFFKGSPSHWFGSYVQSSGFNGVLSFLYD